MDNHSKHTMVKITRYPADGSTPVSRYSYVHDLGDKITRIWGEGTGDVIRVRDLEGREFKISPIVRIPAGERHVA